MAALAINRVAKVELMDVAMRLLNTGPFRAMRDATSVAIVSNELNDMDRVRYRQTSGRQSLVSGRG